MYIYIINMNKSHVIYEDEQSEVEEELWRILVRTSHHRGPYSWVWSELNTHGIEPTGDSDVWGVRGQFPDGAWGDIDKKLTFSYGSSLIKWVSDDTMVKFKGHYFAIRLGVDKADGSCRMEVVDKGVVPPPSAYSIRDKILPYFCCYFSYAKNFNKALELFNNNDLYTKAGALIMIWYNSEKTRWEEPDATYFFNSWKKACEIVGIKEEER